MLNAFWHAFGGQSTQRELRPVVNFTLCVAFQEIAFNLTHSGHLEALVIEGDWPFPLAMLASSGAAYDS